MPNNLLDIFLDDAFSNVSLTNSLANVDHCPGQAGALTFAGVGEGVNTTRIAIEQKDMVLSLIMS